MGKVIVVTSGKGGVGKTTVLANLGIMLATCGKMVCLVDADVGLNNLDVVIGVEIQKKESEAERSDSFSIGLCGKRLTWSAEFGILEKIMSFFLKGKAEE